MNKRIDFSKTGGFPLTQNTLAFMQDSYRLAFAALASMIGDKIIVYGCEVIGGIVSNGWIAVSGELIPFQGGALTDGATVVINDTKGERLFEDGTTQTVYFDKVARFGSPGGFPFTDLKRVGTISGHITDKANPHETTLQQVGYEASDDPALNDAGKLATTKATKSILDKIGMVVGSGLFNIGDVGSSDPTWTITHNLGIAGSYIVLGSIRSNTAADYHRDNRLCWTHYDCTANSFKISIQELSAEIQDVSFAWLIIKL